MALGAQFALVTRDSSVRKYATMLDIPMYPSIRKAEVSHWRSPRRRRKSKKRSKISPRLTQKTRETPDFEELRKSAFPETAKWLVHPVLRVLSFSCGVLGVLAIAAVLVPSAEVNVSPTTRVESHKISLVAHPDIDDVDLSGKIPVRTASVIVEGRGEIKTSGNITVPDTKAVGRVVFTNLTDRELTIPKGTIVSTLGDGSIRFQTIVDRVVQPLAESGIVPIEAVLPGKNGNVPLNTIIAIEGPLGLDLTVTNPGRTSQGADQNLPAPRESDYQNLLDEMLTTLQLAALIELEGNLAENDIILETSPTSFEIIQEEYLPEEPQPSDVLLLTLRVEFFSPIGSGDDMRALAESILLTNVDPEFVPDSKTLTIRSLNQPKMDKDGNYIWNIQVQWEANAIINEAEIVSRFLWQTPESALTRLLDTGTVSQDASITLTPQWWPRLPILPFRLHVTGTE
jgi:hypothetical protein